MASEPWLAEQAREELEILGAQHPNRFDYLKIQLRNLISESENFSYRIYSENPLNVEGDSVSSSASTQVSTNRKRKGCEIIQKAGTGFQKLKQKRNHHGSNCFRDSAEIAMEQAEACLRKIRAVKESFTTVS